MKRILNVLIILFICSNGFAKPDLSDLSYLRKISFRLKGAKPSSTEESALQQAIKNQTADSFIEDKIEEYLKSPEYIDNMTYRLNELFRFKVNSLGYISEFQKDKANNSNPYPTDPLSDNYFRNYELSKYKTTGQSLFRKLFIENKSWDELLIGKNYSISSFNNTQKDGYGFFAALKDANIPLSNNGTFAISLADQYKYLAQSQTHSDSNPSMELHFDSGDNRIAGVITTEDFFTRYINTAINKNRQRAAAIFRVFLCEELTPAIPEGEDKKHAALKLAFPDYEYKLPVGGNIETQKELLHGQKPECDVCHRKLDPAGRNLQTSRVTLAPEATPGALVYENENNETVVIPTNGIGDFAKELTKLPQYSSCQVSHFSKWILGEEFDLNKNMEVKNQLINAFDNNDRKVNDFIKYLLKSEMFKSKIKLGNSHENPKLTFNDVKPLFKRCNACHDSSKIPNFTHLPFENQSGNHTDWISKIKYRVNLPDGSSEKMPMNYMQWEKQDLDLIKKWLNDGAPDEQGQSTYNP